MPLPAGRPRRLGTIGYYVLLPNLYYRAGRDTIYGPDVQEEGSAEHKRMRVSVYQNDHSPVMDDIGSILAFIGQQGAAGTTPRGCGLPC